MCVLGHDDSGKWRTDNGVVELPLVDVDLACGHIDIRPFAFPLGIERAGKGTAAIEFGFAGKVLFHQPAGPVEIQSRFSQQRLSFFKVAFGRHQLCFCKLETGLNIGVVQPREHLVFIDQHALFDINIGDLTGKFRRNGGLPACRDISRRVQNRCGSLAFDLPDQGGAYFNRRRGF